MSTIPILAVIDCEAILNKSYRGTLSTPQYLGYQESSDAYVYLIASASYVYNSPPDRGNTNSELCVNAQIGDTIRWAITSIDRGLKYNAILQGIGVGAEIQLNAPNQTTTPVSSLQTFTAFTGPPQRYQPVALDSVACSDYMMEATILGNNEGTAIQYDVYFYIADNGGNILGYYHWDPYIKVIN